MNLAGSSLLSRQTIASGRGLFLLSFAVILSVCLEVNLSALTVLGVTLEEGALGVALVWVLGALWLSHFMHWIGDLISLGRWNSSMSSKLAQSTYGGGGKMKGRLEFVAENLESALDPEKQKKNADFDFIKGQLRDIRRDLWFFEKFAIFYVVVWHFAVPTFLTAFAIFLICDG